MVHVWWYHNGNNDNIGERVVNVVCTNIYIQMGEMTMKNTQLVNDIMDAVDDNPDAYTNVMGVMASRIIDDGVGSMTVRTLDGDVINVIIIVQPQT